MDLEDYSGFDDSDVYPEGGIGIIGPNNSLMPRFEQDDTSIVEAAASRPAKTTK